MVAPIRKPEPPKRKKSTRKIPGEIIREEPLRKRKIKFRVGKDDFETLSIINHDLSKSLIGETYLNIQDKMKKKAIMSQN